MGLRPDREFGPFSEGPEDGPEGSIEYLHHSSVPIVVVVSGGGLPAPPSSDPEDNPTDLQGQAAARVLTQYRNSAKLLATIAAAIAPLQEIENVATQIPVLDDVDVAGGANLDVTGDLIGQSRGLVNGAMATDPQYRLMIKARIARNRSHSTGPEFLAMLSDLFGAQVILFDSGGMGIGYAIGRALSADEIAVLKSPHEILPRPMGVRLDITEYFSPTDYFGFAEDPNASDFADDSVFPPAGGGALAVEF
jgi:hypothetical protein